MTGTRAPVRQRTYSPSEFSAALADAGVNRSERWVQEHCAAGTIKTLPLPGGRYVIPETELRRLVYSAEGAA
jgi:hypothetical protein